MIWCVKILLALSLGVLAAAEQDALTLERNRIREFSERVLRSCLATGTDVERARLISVTVTVPPDLPGYLLAAADPNKKQIILSTGLIGGLNVYTKAMVLGARFGKDNLESDYSNYFRRRSLYEQPNLLSLEAYCRMSPQALEKWVNDEKAHETAYKLFHNAVAFIVAHEAGHFATNSFYGPGSTQKDIYDLEFAAEKWGIMALLRNNFNPISGSLVANAYLHDHTWMDFAFGLSSSHPTSLERSVKVIESTIASGIQIPEMDNGNSATDTLMSQVKIKMKNWSKLSPEEVASKAREKNSSLLAFVAGRMYEEGKNGPVDLKKAFSYYIIATVGGYEPALVWVGYCFEHGRGTDMSKTKALEWYKRALNAGLLLGKYNYLRLSKELGVK